MVIMLIESFNWVNILVLEIWVFVIEGAWIAGHGKAATTIFDF
jgi:hypothetical protein